MLYCSINGQLKEVISVADRAISYGDGMFTTAKVSGGEIEFFLEHLSRIKEGCLLLNIHVDMDKLTREMNIAASKYEHAVLKVIVSAGSGGRGYSRQGCSSSERIVTVHDIPTHYQSWSVNGIRLTLSELQLGHNPMLKGLKHLNRLEQVLIRAELDQLTYDDVLVTDINNNIVETSSSNVFWYKNDTWYTPNLAAAGVNGIYRSKVLAWANGNANLTMKTVDITPKDLHEIESMFVCNCVAGIIPVSHYLDMPLNIDNVVQLRQCFISANNEGSY